MSARFPLLDERYAAADASGLGSQLKPDELTERIRIELANAFSAGALWQYGRDRDPSRRERERGNVR